MGVFSVMKRAEVSEIGQGTNVDLGHIEICSDWHLSFETEKVTQLDFGEWIFLWYGEFNTLPNFERVANLLRSGDFSELWGLRGVLIAVSQADRKLYIFNDCYGSFPIFLNDGVQIGEPLASDTQRRFADHDVDWVSFYQFLSFGYIFSPYSLFKGVRRLGANNGVQISFRGEKPEVRTFPLKNFWAPDVASRTATIDEFIDILRDEAKSFESTQLMMSGGWDSRLLLAALGREKLNLYTHGNLASREIAIVRDIAAECHLPLIERNFSQSDFNVCQFELFLDKNESAMFTHWNNAGVVANNHRSIMTAGTFGEVLGGHYGTLNTLPGKRKYLSLLMHMLGVGPMLDRALNLHDRHTVLGYLRASGYKVFWFIQDFLAEELESRNLVDKSNDRLDRLFQSYEEEGMESAQGMFERFYTEHRGGQYINRQLTNSARNHGYRNVFTNRDLVAAASSLPFSQRAHNKINREIIKKLSPELLHFPLAATLADAGRPLLIQEASRAARKLVESKPLCGSIYRKVSRYGNRSFGWNDFRGVVDDGWVRTLSPLLTDEIWNIDKIAEAARPEGASNMYPLFDMISKAITLDYQLRTLQFRHS
ncbi:hypothetical protein EDB94_3116 [Marinobacter sp. 3-2]|jgi:hypothetical protein|uniref:hypothetical protein n=1 Tax=Marinobacter sp. 3-2 TaxID=2485141 RepID=UPI000D355836|nr:hypothetical protein [Marinobacter sp. 3-2]ROQ42900.1 hypothetical protein EDB94_3116 [Marinobacter sp. 3-2]